jgi:cell division transport system permease protein
MTEWMGILAMRVNNVGYLLKEGFLGIFRHGFMSFAAVVVTVACLLIVGSFSSLMHNVNIMVEDLNKTNEILVYVDSDLPDAEARSIGTKINRVSNVHQSNFVSREEALKNFVADHDGDEAFSGVRAEDLRHRFVVVLVDNTLMKETEEEIRQIPGVADISAAYELAEGFTTLQSVLQIVTLAVNAVLLVVSLLIISNTVKLAMYDRKDEIAIMKMVGATNGFIRLPFVVEGFALGMMGAAVAFGLEWLMYDALVARINEVDALNLFSFVPFTELLLPMIATFGACGLFVGILGSWASIRKFLDV